MHKQLLRQIAGVFQKNGFHLHGTHVIEEIDRGQVTDQQAAAVVNGIVGVFRAAPPEFLKAGVEPANPDPLKEMPATPHRPRGVYNPAYAYSLGDTVTLGDVTYVSRVEENLGNVPLASPDAWRPIGEA